MFLLRAFAFRMTFFGVKRSKVTNFRTKSARATVACELKHLICLFLIDFLAIKNEFSSFLTERKVENGKNNLSNTDINVSNIR